MASMKDFLEKTILRVGSRGGMPSGGVISLSFSGSSYIAPTDGFLCVRASVDEDNQRFTCECSNGVNLSQWHPRSGTIGVVAPMAKGDTANVYVPNGNESEVFFLRSLGAVGGGLKRLISLIFFGGRYGFA